MKPSHLRDVVVYLHPHLEETETLYAARTSLLSSFKHRASHQGWMTDAEMRNYLDDLNAELLKRAREGGTR